MAQSTVSAHVACLRNCDLVVGRPEGRQIFYSLARPELLDLFAAAETLLTATGATVELCPPPVVPPRPADRAAVLPTGDSAHSGRRRRQWREDLRLTPVIIVVVVGVEVSGKGLVEHPLPTTG